MGCNNEEKYFGKDCDIIINNSNDNADFSSACGISRRTERRR